MELLCSVKSFDSTPFGFQTEDSLKLIEIYKQNIHSTGLVGGERSQRGAAFHFDLHD